MATLAATLALAESLTAGAPFDRSIATAPVMVGNNDLDARISWGEPVGLGIDSLKVRAAPDRRALARYRLRPGEGFWICDTSADDAWTGIVFAPRSNAALDCGVGTPVSGRRPYRGPCQSGWVPSQNVLLVAS